MEPTPTLKSGVQWMIGIENFHYLQMSEGLSHVSMARRIRRRRPIQANHQSRPQTTPGFAKIAEAKGRTGIAHCDRPAFFVDLRRWRAIFHPSSRAGCEPVAMRQCSMRLAPEARQR
jgi:hypothetical protein